MAITNIIESLSSPEPISADQFERMLSKVENIDHTIKNAQQVERFRLGILLRDEMCQVLIAAKMYINMFTPQTEEQKHLQKLAEKHIQKVLQDMNEMSDRIIAGPLVDQGLVQCINTFINEINCFSHFRIGFHQPPTDIENISQAVKMVLFNAIRQYTNLLLNDKRVQNVAISISYDNKSMRMEIKDNRLLSKTELKKFELQMKESFESVLLVNGRAELLSDIETRLLINIP